jgi:hypothetical protein
VRDGVAGGSELLEPPALEADELLVVRAGLPLPPVGRDMLGAPLPDLGPELVERDHIRRL